MIESVQVGVYMADTRGNLFYVNDAFVKIMGYEKKMDVLGLNLAREIYLRAEDRDEFMAAINKYSFVRDYEVKFRRRDGSIIRP